MVPGTAELLSLGDMFNLLVSFTPIGFLLGFFMILVGLAVNGVMKIFKKAA